MVGEDVTLVLKKLESNVRLYTLKLLEKNIGRILVHINCNGIFSDSSPRVMKIKTKMGANDATDKGLVSKIYQQIHAIFLY